jgi:hypothetical protein
MRTDGNFAAVRFPFRAEKSGLSMNDTNGTTNRLAVVSLLAAMLTVISFCIGAAPFLPMTAGVCYPSALLFGVLALVTGLAAQRQIRLHPKRGRKRALLGSLVGCVTILAVICLVTLTLLLLPGAAVFLDEAWKQFRP